MYRELKTKFNEGQRNGQRDFCIPSSTKLGSDLEKHGYEFEQAPGDGESQGSVARCSPWGCKELDTAE